MPPCKVDSSLNIFQCGLLDADAHKECCIPAKDVKLLFNTLSPLTSHMVEEEIAAGISHATQMLKDTGIEFDTNDPFKGL